LTLAGYGSYREPQEVDFSDVRLACITGPNGAGKSTLLDAISFALLGETRTGDMDQVVSEGESKAEVSLTFDHDGEQFRVTRTRTRGKTTAAALEHLTDLGWMSHGEKGVRAVGHEIAQMLRISKETFASTVLLAQGESSRFATADGSERKRILSEILSLGSYAELASTARQSAKEAKACHDAEQARIDEIDRALAGAVEDQESLVGAEQQLAQLKADLEVARATSDTAKTNLLASEGASERLVTLNAQIENARAEQRRRGADAERMLTEAKSRLRRATDAQVVASRKVESARRAAEALAGLEAEMADAQGRIAAADERVGSIVTDGQTAKSDQESAEAEAQRLGTVLSDAEDRLRMLDHDDAVCFTCEQSLDHDKRHTLIDKTRTEITTLRSSIQGAQRRATEAAARRQQLLNDHKVAKTARQGLGTSFDAVTQRLAQARTLAATLDDESATLTAATSEAEAATATLEAVQAEPAMPAEDPVVVGLRAEVAKIEAAQAGANQARAAMVAVVAEVTRIEGEQVRLNQVVGSLRQRLSSYDELRTQRESRLGTARAAGLDSQDYATLARAFGPDGVPNLIFNSVVDELERDASELMEGLTGGMFRLMLRTEAKNKGDGQTKETLDVVIGTPTGDRPYKALSGGERFRVDLALAVGLARLLMRRSGAHIDFLALDEGWGALDPEGIVAMLDALRSLHEEFPLVLTITHTPEVAAAFSDRFEVERDSDGTSVVSMVSA
jgi:exonuclease SbcC